MAVTTKVIRVANPRRGRGAFRLRTARRTNAAKRRKMSPKQIRIFGTPAQKAALKRKRRAKAHTPARRRRKNPTRRSKTRVIYRTRRAKPVRRRRRANPGLVVTLGSVNPRKRRTSVARKRKRNTVRRRRATRARHHRANPVRRRRRRAVAASPVRRRRRYNRRRRAVAHNPRRRRVMRRHNRRRSNMRRHRNPALFGRSSPKDLLKMIGGGLVGVTVTKMIPGYIPASLTSSFGSGGFMAVLVSGVSAWVAGFVAGKVDKEFGEAVLFGGLMQTGSVALNTFLPSIGGQFSLGDLVNGQFVVPQNPISMGNPMAVSAPAARGMSAYGPAY